MSDSARSERKKEAFIADTLLPYYLDRIELEENDTNRTTLQKQIAAIRIFPYLTENGTKYGALKEPGIRWYFTENKETNQTYSTESYRILNKAVLKEGKLLDRFKHTFGTDGCGYIQKFTNDAVIEDLVLQMRRERDYTSFWWRCATDAFALWNAESDPGSTYEKATANIETSYMLYDDEYCEPEYQELLEKHKIFWDIRKTDGYKTFMSSVPDSHIGDALRFLRYLGVPTEFAVERSWGKCSIDTRITGLFNKLNLLRYPVHKTLTADYELCRLSEYLYFQVFCNSHLQCVDDLYDNADTAGGIFIRNIRDEYMPLKVSMFYLPDYYTKERLEEDLLPDWLNMFLIMPGIYSKEQLEQVAHSVEDIDCFESYQFGGIGVKALSFYKWAWRFTQNEELVSNILKLPIAKMGFAP